MADQPRTPFFADAPLVGYSISITDPFVAELVAGAAFDFVLIDMQHTALGVETVQQMLIGLRTSPASTVVRVATNDPTEIMSVLDMGADAVVVPMVNTAAEALSAVSAARYPPLGSRSWGPRRAARLRGGSAAYALSADQDAVVMPQIETREALENLDAILDVPGVGAAIIGPADFALSLGYGQERDHPDVIRSIETVLERSRAKDVPFGIFANSIDKAAFWIERGASWVTCGDDIGDLSAGLGSAVEARPRLRAMRERSPEA